MITTEKRFEADIESFFLSPAGGYTKGADTYDAKQGLYVNTLIDFVQRTQPKEWARFENANQVDPVRKFCTAFNTACETDGLLSVLRHGFKHRGLRFRVCYFKPESALNQATAAQWAANTIECYRQWYFSADTKKERGYGAGAQRHPSVRLRIKKPVHRTNGGRRQAAVDV